MSGNGSALLKNAGIAVAAVAAVALFGVGLLAAGLAPTMPVLVPM